MPATSRHWYDEELLLQNGFVVVPSAFDSGEIEAVVGLTAPLLEPKSEVGRRSRVTRWSTRGGGLVTEVSRPSSLVPSLRRTVVYAGAADLAGHGLGRGAALVLDKIVQKPAEYGAATPWHQDSIATWLPRRRIIVSVPLNTTGQFQGSQGSMSYLSGSHRAGQRRHESAEDGEYYVAEIDESRVAACPLPAGGASVHFDGTLNASAANHSPRAHTILQLHFAVDRQIEGRVLRHQEEIRRQLRRVKRTAGPGK